MGSSWRLQAAVCATASVVLAYALAQGPKLTFLIVALALGAAGCVVAITRPRWLFAVAIAALTFIPIYASPAFGPILFAPVAVALWILAAGLIWRRLFIEHGSFSLSGIDVAVVLFMALMAISVGFSGQPELRDYLQVAFLWLGGYLGGRMFLREQRAPELLALGFAVATAVMMPFAVLEATTGANPFLHLSVSASATAEWVGTQTRFGATRIEVAFGHAIALAMFFSTSALLSLNMAIHTARFRDRALWLVAAGLGAVGQALTVSRAGWVLLAVGVVGLLLTAGRGAARRRMTWLLAGLVVGAIVAAQLAPPDQLRVLPGAGSVAGSASVADSSGYRWKLLHRAVEPGVLNPWGNPSNHVAPAVSAGNFATDNQYIIFGDTWGLIPLAAFLLIVFFLVHTMIRAVARGGGALAGIPLVALANCVGLFVVALITQQQIMVWLLIGASGAVAERLGALPARRPARRPVLAPPSSAPGALERLPLPSR